MFDVILCQLKVKFNVKRVFVVVSVIKLYTVLNFNGLTVCKKVINLNNNFIRVS